MCDIVAHNVFKLVKEIIVDTLIIEEDRPAHIAKHNIIIDEVLEVLTSHVRVGEHGERKEETEFHHIVVFGKLAETTTEYLGRGSLALVEGRLRTRSWEQEGIKRYRTEIIAERIQFGPRRQEETSADDPADVTTQIDGSDDVPY
jgi:single stranded DNA-binding protein